MAKTRLSKKRRVFIEEYLQCWNGAEAARRAGYKFPTRRASVLLMNSDIQKYIEKRISEIAMSADEVLLRLGEQGRGDISEFVKSGGAIDWEKVKEKGYLIKRIAHHAGKSSTIELYDGQRALELLGKHHRLFVERQLIEGKVTHDISDDLRGALLGKLAGIAAAQNSPGLPEELEQ